MSIRPPAQPRFVPAVHRLRPWYHDFSALGLQTVFGGVLGAPAARIGAAVREILSGHRIARGARHPLLDALRFRTSSHRVNQTVKETAVRPLLEQALAELDRPSCLDLFCADGYYSCWLAARDPQARVLGVDLDPMEIRRARTAASALRLYNAQFLLDEVNVFLHAKGAFDLILCMGGLYHLSQPRALLAAARRACRGFLLVQSVVSLVHEDPDYYETPAPNWQHGSRFSHARLASWLAGCGWEILTEKRNELPGNRQLHDRGSSYFLCRVADTEATTASVSRDSG